VRRAILSPFALALLLGGGREARANLITLNSSADTYITENGDLGGPDSNHAGDALLFSIQGTGPFLLPVRVINECRQ
jgi:hypothetical protein